MLSRRSTTSWHRTCYDDEIHCGSYSSILDFTLGKGSLAFACIKANVPFMAFAFNEFHANALFKHVLSLMLQAMRTEGTHGLYDLDFAKVGSG
jgi:hypothetical protein